MVKVTCTVCNTQFEVKPYRAKTAKFCSWRCMGIDQTGKTREYKPHPWAAKNLDGHRHKSPTRFTSERTTGSAHPRWKDEVELICEHCGKTFSRKEWLIKQNKTRFCSVTCFRQSRCFAGHKSPTWVGGSMTYRGRNWRQQRELVIERQQGNCADCGHHIGQSLPVHHIKPYRDFESYVAANQISNLIGVCRKCHVQREPPLKNKSQKQIEASLLLYDSTQDQCRYP